MDGGTITAFTYQTWVAIVEVPILQRFDFGPYEIPVGMKSTQHQVGRRVMGLTIRH